MVESITSTVSSMTTFVTAIAGISLLVAAVSIFNVMMMSVTERVREIGILRSIGTQRSEVLRMFIYEAVIIGIVGAAIGAVLSLIVGYAVWGRIISRKGYRMPLLICAPLLGLYPILTGLAKDQLWLPFIAIAQGFFTTGVDIAFFDTLLAVSPTERRPSFIALNTMLASLTIFFAPLVGNFLADWVGIPVVFFIAGGFHILTALLFWRFKIVR